MKSVVHAVALTFFTMLAVSCGDPTGNGGSTSDPANNGGKGDIPGGPPVFQVCADSPVPTGLDTVDFEHTTSSITASFDPGHSAQDVITNPDVAATITGKFAYGDLSKDLEDERIEVWMDDCAGAYTLLGEATTDDDGRIALELPVDELPPVGRYALYLRVMGDNTFTQSTLSVFPAGTKIMVFDIDGTLTTSDGQLFADIVADFFEPIASGDFVPAARAGATELTHLRWDTQQVPLVYLTGRPYLLTASTREWLTDLDFAPATLHLASSNSDVLPTNGSVGEYKAAYLASLEALDFEIIGAYGNATTDIYAYADAGVPLDSTFIAGTHGGEDGTVAVGDDYVAHVDAVGAESPVEQPFDMP